MGKVNVFIKHYYLDKAGEAPVIVEYTHNQKRWRINPDIKVDPKLIACIYDFDIEAYKLSALASLKPDQRTKIQVNNVLLQNMQAKFNAIVMSFKARSINPEVDYVKQEYQKGQIQVEAKSKTVAEHFAEFIKNKEREIGSGINSYRATWRHFEMFSDKMGLIFLEDLKRELLDNFRIYLKGTGLGGPSIHKHFKDFRIFLNWVKDNDENEQIQIPSAYKNLKLKVRYGDPIGLSVEQFMEFYNIDLSSSPELERTRDLIIFGVSIGGPRHGDLQRIGESLRRHGYNLNNTSITYFESKTGNAHKEIYVNKFGMEVLKKYDQFPYVPSNWRIRSA
ncbi:tyrosine-type recombinase/integrase [Chryseolinea lacunae]|uniref:Phage integrase SAM-like domain-containing protein n=1 Tax=Chryseolinea lacunae TaxID=2801331 RepID=A0ABS1L352_9BACT|nr:phage integrase SAM-like domain-containing protein [Chryseolinea lacunae]MBL0745932.1 phage integrase SAM-like domain-containing protein [Chryseolinea lacunae]